MKTKLFKCFILTLSVLWLFSCGTSDQRPNIILIHSDELQFEDLGYCGGPIPTPHIDALAAEGLTFDHVYVPAPMCTPSRFSLLTGNYPGRCKHPAFLVDNPTHEPYIIGWNTFLDSSTLTLPKLLGQHGYQTAMVGKWHLGEHLEADSLLADFDSKDEASKHRLLAQHQKQVVAKIKKDGGFAQVRSAIYKNFDMFPVKELQRHNFPWFAKGALDLLERFTKQEAPFFLYLATTSLHGPHHAEGLERDYSWTPEGKVEVADFATMIAEAGERTKEMSSPQSHRYVGMQFLDELVGQVNQQLESLGIDDNTIVIFLPDHNTEPAKATCYHKGLQIPMIIKWPTNLKGGQSTDARVSNADIFPTLLDLIGVESPRMDGLSFAKALKHPADFKGRSYTYAEAGYTRSISDGELRYIAFRYPQRIVEGMKSGAIDWAPNYVDRKRQGQSVIAAHFYPDYFQPDQLYDLSKDPYEQQNLASDPAYQSQKETLQRALEAELATFEHPFSLAIDPFIYSEAYTELVQVTKQASPDSISWYARDWGKIIWPPSGD